MITWDEPKRLENLRKHEMDFVGCEAVFDHPVLTQEDTRDAYGEQRMNLIGWLHGQWVHLTYIERNERLHAISLRKATPHELRQYRKTFSKHR
ncbi:MAG: BrnT family toxin [Candidatus Competibacter sp.]|nr:BrnT family toxin [Candidatus Competibacter sp.]